MTPLRIERCNLLFWPFAFHRQHAGGRPAQGSDRADHFRQRCKRPRDHGVKGVMGAEAFGAGMFARYIVETQLACGVLDKADLLPIRVDEREAPVRIDHCERQPRKSRPGAHIRHVHAAQIGMNGETVEQMMRQHVVAVADSREVVGAVPALQLVDEAEQTLRVRLGEWHTQFGALRYQTLHYAQSRLPPTRTLRRSRQKPRFLPAGYEVMSAEIAGSNFGQ